MESTTIAVDLAKDVFEVGMSGQPGVVSGRHRFKRARFEKFIVAQPPSLFVMEACGMAHHWGRQLLSLGHQVKLIPPHVVRPFVTGNKTDRTDVDGILDASRKKSVKPVPVKTLEQQQKCGVLSLREGLQKTRITRSNELRGLLREQGITIPKGAGEVVPAVRDLLENAPDTIFEDVLREMLLDACKEIEDLDARLAKADEDIRRLAKKDDRARAVATIPGVGPLLAATTVWRVGSPERFRSGRALSNFFGLTPKEHSSGHRRWLGGITKRGDSTYRKIVIQGAGAVLNSAARMTPQHRDPLRQWVLEMEAKHGRKKAVVALANKLTRIIWKVWMTGEPYNGRPKTRSL